MDDDVVGFVHQEAGGVEDLALAEPVEPVLAGRVDRPGGHGRGVLQRAQAVLLRLVVGLPQPREIVGDAPRPGRLLALIRVPRVLAGSLSGPWTGNEVFQCLSSSSHNPTG